MPGQGGSPVCQSPVPALSSDRLEPGRAATGATTPSAEGERQMLPRQTNRMRVMARF